MDELFLDLEFFLLELILVYLLVWEPDKTLLVNEPVLVLLLERLSTLLFLLFALECLD